MGVCISSHIIRQHGCMNLPSRAAMVIDMEGCLQEFRQPIKAVQILSLHPGCFLCSSETMHVNTIASPVSPDDELQLGQLYFLIPISKSQTPLTLQDLCSLAIKASSALNASDHAFRAKSEIVTPFLHENNKRVNFLARPKDWCRMPYGYKMINGINSHTPFRQSTR